METLKEQAELRRRRKIFFSIQYIFDSSILILLSAIPTAKIDVQIFVYTLNYICFQCRMF